MRKILALLLALSMLFAFSGCGRSKELTAEEKERIYQEVAAEKAKSGRTNVGQTSMTNEDYFTFENPELVALENGLYVLDFKFTCLYPEQENVKYPEMFDINYVCLDNEGTVVQECMIQVDSLFYGDSYKASAIRNYKVPDNQFSLDNVSAIRFVSCQIWEYPVRIERFANPVTFELEGLVK